MPELFKSACHPLLSRQEIPFWVPLWALQRATTSEPKTDDTDEVLNAGLRLAAQPDAPEERLQRMLAIVQTEKHRVAPAAPPVPCPAATRTITILSRLWAAPESIRTLKRCKCFLPRLRWPKKRPQGQAQAAVYQLLFTLAEDWDEELLPCCATRRGALPGVNPGRKAAAFTLRVCSGSVPGTNQKGPPFCVFLWQFRNTAASKCIPVSFTPDFLPFSESFLQKKRLYKPFLKTYYISNIFHGANAVQPPVQHPNTIKEGFIYARKEKDHSGCSCR